VVVAVVVVVVVVVGGRLLGVGRGRAARERKLWSASLRYRADVAGALIAARIVRFSIACECERV